MRVSRARYREDHDSFGAFIMSPQAAKPVGQISRSMSRRMRQTAPRSNDQDGPAYADSFDVRPVPGGLVAGKYRNRRVAFRVVNTTRHAPVVEFGRRSKGGGKRRRARRTMLRAGLRYGGVSSKGGR